MHGHHQEQHQHQNQHGDHDWSDRGPDLIADGEANAPMVNEALSWLAARRPGARQVIDVGSGPGVAATALAALLPDAQVLAVDGSPALLALARERAGALGCGDRFETREAALPGGLAGLPPADLLWISGVAHHLPDPAAAVADLARALRPGGIVALREGGLPLRFLPEYADRGLASRLDAYTDARVHGGDHPMGVVVAPRSWPDLLRDAGLAEVTTRSFLLDRPAPLNDTDRGHLRRHLTTYRERAADHLDAGDLAALDRLTADDSPESVLHRRDAFLLRATTIHTGTRV